MAAALPADPEPEAASPKRARLSRIFGRRHEEEQDEEPYQSFDLPEPDAVFERPWLQTPPRPTRDWDRPLGTALGTTAETSDGSSTEALAEPVVAPAPVPTAAEPAPEPITPPEPVAEPEPEPVAEQPEPAPGPAPEPVAEPEPTALVHPTPTPSRRPRPGPTPPHRPRPTAGPTPGPVAPTTIGIAGISGVAGQHRPAHAAPSGTISGSIGTSTTTPPLDLSRFLQTTEPRPEDDEDEDGRSDHHDGPPPGTGMSADSDGGGGPRRPGRSGRSGRSGRGSRLRRTLVRSVAIVAVAVLAAVLLRAFVVQPYYIPSASMEPTLHGCPTCNDDRVLVDKFSYRIHSPRVRDIVVFHRPPGVSAESVLIKRIVALGGDVVQLRDGDLYVNGLQVDEPYINKACGAHATRPLTNVSRWVVPANDVFVMGDNRCDSLDSRSFGPIPVSSIIGRAFAIVWPLKRARLL
ncbi:MAG: signal peptidase I [Actinobacteria bacterium]|nr:signal peptidase I [Actinomycetota bacterium]